MKYLFINLIIMFNLLLGQSDSLWTEVFGDTVIIHHDNTERNCGALFEFNAAFIDSNIIVITEIDTGTMALCDCEFNLELMLGGLSAGTWIAEIYGHDLENNGVTEYYGSVEFTVDIQQGTGFVLNGYQSPCNYSSNTLAYFPLEIGFQWEYQSELVIRTETIVDTVHRQEQVFFDFWVNEIDEHYLIRESNNRVYLWYPPDTTSVLLYDFQATVGDTWTLPADFACGIGTAISLADTMATVITLTDTFENCYRFTHQPNCFDAGIWETWFAPGIGKVQYYEDNWGGTQHYQLTQATILATFDDPEKHEFPSMYRLSQNFPNPFNPVTTIRYELPIQTEVNLTIYNIMGQEVETLVNGKLVAGEHEVIWNADNLSSGIYFYRLETPNKQITKKLVVLK